MTAVVRACPEKAIPIDVKFLCKFVIFSVLLKLFLRVDEDLPEPS